MTLAGHFVQHPWVNGFENIPPVELHLWSIDLKYASHAVQDELARRYINREPAAGEQERQKQQKKQEKQEKQEQVFSDCMGRFATNVSIARIIGLDSGGAYWHKLITGLGTNKDIENEAFGILDSFKQGHLVDYSKTLGPKNRRKEYLFDLLLLLYHHAGVEHAELFIASIGEGLLRFLSPDFVVRIVQYIVQNNDRPQERNEPSTETNVTLKKRKLNELHVPGILNKCITATNSASNSNTSRDTLVEASSSLIMSQRSTMPDCNCLLLLMSAFDGCKIPDLFFQRIRSSQGRWTDNGDYIRITARDINLCSETCDMLLSEDFPKLLDTLVEDGAVELFNEFNNKAYHIRNGGDSMRTHAFHGDSKSKWIEDAQKLIFFVYPRDRFWEAEFQTVGRSLFPLLEHIIHCCMPEEPENENKIAVIECLVSASRVMKVRASEILDIADRLSNDELPEYLRTSIVHRQSILLRLQGNFVASERKIEEYHSQMRVHSANKRDHALRGHLYVSHLENLIQKEEYQRALQEGETWSVTPTMSSMMSLRVIPSQSMAISKILRCQGKFHETYDTLQNCYSTIHPMDASHYQIICSLADICCELKRLEEADELLRPRIKALQQHGHTPITSKALRRLLVSLADCTLAGSQLAEAQETLDTIGTAFEQLTNLDVSDQMLHVRSLIASARISQLKSQFNAAIGLWHRTSNALKEYSSFENEGFTYAICQLSTSLALCDMSRTIDCRDALVQAGQATFNNANDILRMNMRDYWLPTIATMWLPYTQSKIKELEGWVLG